jgi:Do/DeqQ family serine protease
MIASLRNAGLRLAALLLASLSIAGAAPSASAQEATVPESAEQIRLSFAPVVKKVAPAVVNIYTRRVVQTRSVSPMFDDPFFRQFFGDDSGLSAPRERVQNSLGSGVIVSADGLVVTNEHVVNGAEDITVVLGDRREFEATVVTHDERTDLSVLHIDPKGEPLPTLLLADSDSIEVGDLVLALGNPFGVGQTVTSGIVSAVARTQVGITDLGFFIQTDAAINPGNSGGALVNMKGELVGINTAIFSRSGGSVGIGFAIPANMVATVVAAAGQGGRPVRPWLGVTGQALSRELAEGFGLDRAGGVVLNQVHPKSPAATAGLELGDVILAFNNHEVLDPAGLRFRVATAKIGGDVSLKVLRDGHPEDVVIKLVAAPEDPPRDETVLDGEEPLAGATIVNLSPAVAEELGVDDAWDGVMVLSVARGSPARRIGLKPGDVLLEVGGREVKGVSDVKDAIAKPADSWRLSIRRGGQIHTIVLS